MKTVLITGIGGLTPRSIAKVIRKNHPDYKLIGVDTNKKAVGFFMEGLLDKHYVCPRCDSPEYFPFIEKLVKEMGIDYAFVEPESEIVAWGDYYKKHGKYPCPTFMGDKELSVSLKDKSIMAELLEGTEFIPKTIKVTQDNPRYEDVEKEIGFPCWIRATEGTGGLGSLKLEDLSSYKSWLFINSKIPEFTVSEFLTGRHLANQMLYYEGEYVKGGALECAEYVMANTAPSHVTGNTAFGRFLNEDRINKFCDDCIKYLEKKLNLKAHGILSFDLKEDSKGNLKVTEVNIRHMAYTGVMAETGFDLIEDTIKIMEDGNADRIERAPYYHYDKPYIFLRDVDVEPILLEGEEVFDEKKKFNNNEVKDLIIVCAGTYGKEALAIAEMMNEKKKQWNILGFLDDNIPYGTEIYHHYRIIGTIKDWEPKGNEVFALGVAMPATKEKIYNLMKPKGAFFATLINPLVSIKPEFEIGEGCIIGASTLGINVKLGKCVKVSGSMVGSSTIGDFSTTTGYANISDAYLGKRVFVGSHAVVLNGRKVGDDAFICAGSIVMSHVKPGTKVMGYPARKVNF